MWKSKELSLEEISQELPKVREKLERVFPNYVASLRRVSERPMEFERRCRASWIEEFLERTRQSYQEFVGRCMMGGFFGGMMANLVATITRQPMMPTERLAPSSLVNLAIWPSGEVRPVLKDTPPAQTGVITVSFERFERVALQLKNGVLSEGLVLQEEGQIPKIMYNFFARGESTI